MAGKKVIDKEVLVKELLVAIVSTGSKDSDNLIVSRANRIADVYYKKLEEKGNE